MDDQEEEKIDFWKQDTFEKGAMKHSLVQETSFATLFAKYREKYLSDHWSTVVNVMKGHGIHCELDLREGSMLVKTTKTTWDPFAILKARDMLRMLSRGVDVEQASKIFKDDMFCDIIKIGGFVQSKERFVKRRQRLVGPNGTTLKAIELLTNCYVLVHGTTVCAMGPVQGLENVRRIVEDCMKNIHPVYNIKEMMIKREVNKNPELSGEDWSRFLPKFKKAAGIKRKKPKHEKKEYTPFPPAQPLSEIDKQLESGEYFLGKDERELKRKEEKLKANATKSAERAIEKAKVFIPPVEPRRSKSVNTDSKISTQDTIKSIQQNISKTSNKRKGDMGGNASDFFVQKKKK